MFPWGRFARFRKWQTWEADRLQDSLPLTATVQDLEPREGAVLDVLAQRAAEGDTDAFEQIYNLLADELYSYICGQCHNETVAEDILANVFLKAWRSAHRYHAGSDRFRRWIFAIARNEVRDHWRTSQRTLPFLDYDITDESEPLGSGNDPEEARREVTKAMAILTEEQRQVVVLRYFSNKSHEEIAGIMGKREGAVRALLLRALRRMRKSMADTPAPAASTLQ
jgi:RNA polymerase sigma-70 factor (ECF subfamily)